jgi:Flp pilus assembly protein TadG
MSTFRRADSGQALVELAFVVPVLALMMLGGVEIARVSFAAIEVSNAARAAAQYGAMNGGAFSSTDSTGLDSAGMLTAARADAGELGSSVTFTTGFPTESCKCSGSGTATCGSAPGGCNPPGSQVETTITVETQATFDPLIYIPLPGWTGGTFTLHGFDQEQVLPI